VSLSDAFDDGGEFVVWADQVFRVAGPVDPAPVPVNMTSPRNSRPTWERQKTNRQEARVREFVLGD
jgi:hypothetical protein